MRAGDFRPAAAAFAFALGVLLAPTPARACTITATGVAFGAYNPQAAGADNGTGTIALACATGVTAPVVTLSPGLYGSYAVRRMGSGANRLNYNLYSNSARTTIWGDGTSGTVAVTFTGGTVSGGQRHFSRSVFGRIPALQNVQAGTYGDTIIVTVTF